LYSFAAVEALAACHEEKVAASLLAVAEFAHTEKIAIADVVAVTTVVAVVVAGNSPGREVSLVRPRKDCNDACLKDSAEAVVGLSLVAAAGHPVLVVAVVGILADSTAAIARARLLLLRAGAA
jgi:hypothetical protein